MQKQSQFKSLYFESQYILFSMYILYYSAPFFSCIISFSYTVYKMVKQMHYVIEGILCIFWQNLNKIFVFAKSQKSSNMPKNGILSND